MYSLPITTYSDYWRSTKKWSSYLGWLAVFAAGTRYSSLEISDISHSIHLHPLQITLNTEKSNPEIDISDFRVQAFNQGIANQSAVREDLVSEGVSIVGPSSQEVASQDGIIQEVSGQGLSSQGIPDEGAGDQAPSISVQILEKEIPFETHYIESDKLLPGMSQTQEKGESGILREVIKTLEVDGQPVDQQVKSSYELKSPKTEVIIQNSKPIPEKRVIVQTPKPAAAEQEVVDLSNLKISKTLNVEASAYTYTGNNTATGVKPREGLIAVDPKVIAMGSKVYVEGYGFAIAADTGGSILGNRIDVFFGTLRQCVEWGRKPVRIHILNST